jgi:hypothetical protein
MVRQLCFPVRCRAVEVLQPLLLTEVLVVGQIDELVDGLEGEWLRRALSSSPCGRRWIGAQRQDG